ncbi:glycosyltransferase family 25 protein [Paraburkholderia dinghuensis]|uniref:Glycosyltransferase family 25 protein n=1 Tax=Paraburkholderia dinghuensis TaxID=2305225 RepID=A0A3N6MX32_9BURK|nr:glycosyltransferase family 25 protein [Paraburkholderia dinghuensis]RQH08309.1 glycosyltransferase family 25 protein [Paraburkholderia dinghuensis]
MRAFIISLKDSQCESNKEIASILEQGRFEANFIDAVYGPGLSAKEYFVAVRKYFNAGNSLVTPSELGCALSHKKAYEAFLRTGDSHALILEDDVILEANACEKIQRIMGQFGNFEGYLHLGGIEGLLESFGRVGGTICCEVPPVFKVNRSDLRYLYRTVGYVISSAFAKKIVNLMDQDMFVIDDFSHIRQSVQIGEFYFANIVKHPVDPRASSIQSERDLKGSRRASSKLAARIYRKLAMRIEREIDIALRSREKIINQLRAIDAGSLPLE